MTGGVPSREPFWLMPGSLLSWPYLYSSWERCCQPRTSSYSCFSLGWDSTRLCSIVMHSLLSLVWGLPDPSDLSMAVEANLMYQEL